MKKLTLKRTYDIATVVFITVVILFTFTTNTMAEENALTLLEKGADLIVQGKYSEAINVLTQALKEDFPAEQQLESNYAVIYANRGDAYFKLGLADKALEDYNSALELDKTFPEVLLNRGL